LAVALVVELDTADPMLMVVVDPETPAVPMLTVLVLPEPVAPVPKPYVAVLVEEPTVTVDAENVVVPENVCVNVLIVASVPVTFGSVYVRVVAVVMPDNSNNAFFVLSVLSCSVNLVSSIDTTQRYHPRPARW
jgi:hypothetical protein